jgi:signal transduction histidine kinase
MPEQLTAMAGTLAPRPDSQQSQIGATESALGRPSLSRKELVRAEQVKMVYRTLPGALGAGVFGALLLSFGIYRGMPPTYGLSWLAAFFAATLLAAGLWFWQGRSLPDPGKVSAWAARANIIALVMGLAWGAAGLVLFEDNYDRQLLLAFALMLVSISGVTAGSAYLPQAFAFTTPVLAPITIRMAVVGDQDHLIIAAGMLLMILLMLYYASQLHKLIVRSIENRFENAELNEALTEQRVKERTRILEIASQHKSEFLSNMSHELRTPLNAVIGFSEVLKDGIFGEMNDKQSEYVQDIHASGHHLLSLINDILDLSKVEAGRMELAVTVFDLPAAINGAVMLVHERAARHQLSVQVQVDQRLGSFNGDERKFKQILLNLLSNAVKFTAENGSIFLHAKPCAEGVQIAVRDTGIGIAPQHHEEIFQAFHQVGDSTKKPQGTGLGLTLVKQFVELHGGRIEIESALAKGSTFTFTLTEQHDKPTSSDH